MTMTMTMTIGRRFGEIGPGALGACYIVVNHRGNREKEKKQSFSNVAFAS